MKSLPKGMVATAVVMLLLALPVQAQDGSSVTFDGVGFSFDRTLGSSVNVNRVPGVEPEDPESIDVPDARHIAFSLYGSRAELARVPRVADTDGVVRVYETADLDGYGLASERLEQLRTILADRPDLATFMQVTDDVGGEELPFLPVVGAGQAIRARAQYIDTPEVSGIAYVTAFRQDIYPFGADDFWYTFQGLSADGSRYISVSRILEADMFPERVSIREANRIAARISRWVRYVTESTATLNAASPTAFTPPLTSLDALVRSITFGSVPTSTVTPEAPTAPSPAASAAG